MSASFARTTAVALCCTAALAVSYTPVIRAQSPNPPGPSSPTRIVTETDLDLDETYNVVITRDFTYQGGNATQLVTTIDGNTIIHADGTPDSILTQTSTFNGHGDPVQDVVLIDSLADGVIDTKRIVDYSYDSKGNLLLRVDDLYNYSTNVKLNHNTIANTWDSHGNLLTQVSEFDFSNDGVVDRRQTTTNVYNGSDLITNTFEVDENGDGTVDQRNITTVQRQKNGKVTGQITTIDDPVDGSIDQVRTTSNLVYSGNTLLQLSTELDTAPIGPPVEWRSITTFSYDNRGLRTGLIATYDVNLDTIVDSTLVTTLTYDQQKNLTQSVADVDIDADGFADQNVRVTYTY